MAYIHFTDEQKQRANAVDLVDFLQRQGEQLVRSGREWRWKRFDSVTLRGNRWFRHSRQEGGLAINFVQEFYDLSFAEAMTLLLGGESGVEWNQTAKSAPSPRKEFALPPANPDMRRVFAYLIKKRYISREVLSCFAQEKLIYEDREYHNAVFVGRDEKGVPRHAHKRGTYTQGEPYKGNVEGGDPRYSFHWHGKSDIVFVFEAPVDLLSFITLYPKHWRQHSYVALDGLWEHALLQQLALNPHLKKSVLCLDHDEAGIEATERLKDILRRQSYCTRLTIEVLRPQNKDWNEDLKARHGVTPLPAQRHPKLELLPQLCDQLLDFCKSYPAAQHPCALLTERLQTLHPLLEVGKLTAENAEPLNRQLRLTAASALLLTHNLGRETEATLSPEQAAARLQAAYKPHEDRGRLRTKAEDLRADIREVTRRLAAGGSCTPEGQKSLLDSCLKLALDCVKAQLSLALEAPLLHPFREQGADLTMTL